MTIADFASYANEAPKHSLRSVIPQIVVGGICGAGKSSLLNAIVRGKAFEIDPSKPCTVDNDRLHMNSDAGRICFIDSPGFSEADKQSSDYAGRIQELISSKAHLYLLVVGAPSRSLDVENEWLRRARALDFFAKVPGIVAINKIDMLPPIRDWNPARLNLSQPSSLKERNITEYINYISEISEFQPFQTHRRIIPVSAGESYNDPAQYNLDNLRTLMFELLPDAAKVEFGRQAYLHQKAAETAVRRYALSVAAEVLLNPVGLGSDAALIIPIQIAMTVHIAKIYGQNITLAFATSLVSTLFATVVGKTIFGAIVASIPGLKHFAGPPVAYALTIALGSAVTELFASQRADATKEEIQAVAQKYAALMEKAAQDCPPNNNLHSHLNSPAQ